MMKRRNNSVKSTNNSEKEGASKSGKKRGMTTTKNIEALYEHLKSRKKFIRELLQ